MRILGIDYGSKRIGVSMSDNLLITAQGQDTIQSQGLAQDIAKIEALVREHGAVEIVVGLPLNMNGTYSKKTEEVAAFVEALSKSVEVPVKTWDERLTSLQAERVMLEADLSRRKRRRLSDKIAAQMILQGYLDARKRG